MEKQESVTTMTRRGICTPSAMHRFKYEIKNVYYTIMFVVC
jgi:hypothetical protein